jgi:hypothetical protein
MSKGSADSLRSRRFTIPEAADEPGESRNGDGNPTLRLSRI